MNRAGTENRPAGEVRAGTRWLLVAFAGLTFLAVTQLLLLADVADRYWAWTIRTELTAAFLGAAYGAGFVLAVASLRQDDWSRIRVPVVTGHSESVNVQTERDLSPEDARELLSNAPGLVVLDDPGAGVYPLPIAAEQSDQGGRR